eukprot:8348351-Ditylum_brightwellii.AAC.1
MKESKLIVFGEDWALLHSCKKPVSSKELASREEIVDMKESKLGKQKLSPKDKIALSQMNWENILRHRNVTREDDEVY